MDNLLEGLNNEQLEAVTDIEGILSVLAGAGSGKTRVLTTRIAYMINSRVRPYNILGVTFTNKAAKEMKARLEKILGQDIVKSLWVGTFHGICGKILRNDIENYKNEENIVWKNNFVIYDQDESLAVIKNALKELNMDDKIYKPKTVQMEISNAKNKMQDAYTFATHARDYRSDKIGQVFTLYEKALNLNNALDFDDLLLTCVKLLEQNKEVREKYHNKFKHILVDEFQDTNLAQYKLINLLFTNGEKAENLDLENRTLCVVGDIDQSIYSWRGADYKILLNFKSDFPQAKTIKLEKNYRSCTNILEAANNVIKNNIERVEKNLYSTKGRGNKIQCFEAQDHAEEAYYIANEVKRAGEKNYKNTAILYRTNAQSRAIEEAFMAASIPYRMVGGLKFYERKEIKDIVAYLRLLYNLADSQALKRIINVPKRSIGAATFKKLEELAMANSTSVFDIIEHIENHSEEFSAATIARLATFRDLILDLETKMNIYPINEFVSTILIQTGYLKELEDEDTVESQTRIDNLQEFINVANEFAEIETEDEMGEFLAQIALVSDTDEIKEDMNAVTLMTLHSAKGLEYPTIFLSGLEEGIFPLSKARESNSELEEERRLMYVGITRAQENLYITYAKKRQMWGEWRYSEPSRFIFEIPSTLMDTNFSKKDNFEKTQSTFRSAVQRLADSNKNNEAKSFSTKPVINKDAPVSNSSFGKNFVAPVYKKKTTVVKTNPAIQEETEKEHKQEFKNVISGVEQARAMIEKLKAKKEAENKPQLEDLKASQMFNVGDTVMHEHFGIGKITNIISIGSSTLYKIDFNKIGIKAVDAEFNRLTKV